MADNCKYSDFYADLSFIVIKEKKGISAIFGFGTVMEHDQDVGLTGRLFYSEDIICFLKIQKTLAVRSYYFLL